jgi:two-component system cell cycle sensor histidine kinase/response regulator CckA
MPPTTILPYRVDPQPQAAAPGAIADAARGPADVPQRLMAALAHNVNNGLAGVIAYLELALRAVEPGSPVRAHLTQGLRCALEAAGRVRRTIAFARRPEAADATVVSLRGAAEQAAGRAAINYTRLQIVFQGADSLCAVRVNEPLLHLVLEQVISNAAEAMPGGGTLTLRAWDEGHRRCLSVADSGHGLSAEVRRHLFEPFFTTKSFGHLGLGLSLCRDVIEAHGGALHVTSTEGHGMTVTLSFPPHEASGGVTADPHFSPTDTFAI